MLNDAHIGAIVQRELDAALSYDPETGVFKWKVPKKGARKDRVAGSKTRNNYLSIGLNGKKYQAHRLAWLYVHGEWPEHEIDHINGDKMDNRIANLRDVPRLENNRNASRPRHNTSGVTGVHLYKATGRWSAHISLNNEKQHLGYHDHLFEAVAARKSAENRLGFHPNHGRSA